MKRFLLQVVFLLFAALAANADELHRVIDDFPNESSVKTVTAAMPHGNLGATKPGWSEEGFESRGALRVDYQFLSELNEHIVYLIPHALNLSSLSEIEFMMKGDSLGTHIYLALYDESGGFAFYGPHSGLTDFTTASKEWKRCVVDFRKNSPTGTGADLSRISRIGFMLNDAGRKDSFTGSVLFDDIILRIGDPRIQAQPPVFSPNGDGVNDTTRIAVDAEDSGPVRVKILDSKGITAHQVTLPAGNGWSRSLDWDGKTGEGRFIPPGKYRLEAVVLWNGNQRHLKGEVTVSAARALKTAEPVTGFFPIGAWYEGAPTYNGITAMKMDPRQYYEKTFADLAAHRINTLAIPNLPAKDRDMVLRIAEKNGIKVILEIGELVAIVSSGQYCAEESVYETAQKIVQSLKDYPALLRYQIRDEPMPPMVPNWIMVKRALEDLDPAHPAFSCFCIVESMQNVFKQTRVNEAVYDCYPVGFGTPPGYIGGFVPTMDAVNRVAGNSPLWMVLQVHGAETPTWTGLRTPLPEELRLMTYLSLTRGAKGIFYFVYQSEQGWKGMVDEQLNPLPIYAEVGKLAGELRRLGPVMLELSPVESITRDVNGIEIKSFKDSLENRYIILANYDVKSGREVPLEISLPSAPRKLVNLRTNRELDFTFENQSVRTSIWLKPGDGTVIKVEK